MYNKRFKHIQHKKMQCEECDFIPQDKVQLDLVYKDGKTSNKKKSNLITLCANCSRLHNKKVRKFKKSIIDLPVDSDMRIS